MNRPERRCERRRNPQTLDERCVAGGRVHTPGRVSHPKLHLLIVAAVGVGTQGMVDWSRHLKFENANELSETFRAIIERMDAYFDGAKASRSILCRPVAKP